MTQTILIVGASRGLGLGLVAEHLKRGFDVIATVRKTGDEPALKALPGSDRLTIHHLDVTSDADIARLAAALPDPIDVVFINAGISGPKSVVAATADELNAAMQANVFGPIRLAHALADRVREQTGVLALMSSIMGSIAENTSGGMEVYRATKTAQNSFARSLWLGSPRARGVTVLSVHPGWVKTDMGGAGADIDVDTSVSGIADQLKAHAGSHAHRFIDYSGREIAW
ncbi:SDR family NAD(P)-dependent oxidoreductase [Brevundimonas subvibrioides]|uniref:Short-chain dehydrogenase/reductase SDR n=1 Tax=Brevundimonas subvibrioides (strain ATCC 15264 / DSM 4735 / LMG 14903 / NBRC 16000 / CB 81) TaxID=633149 RepID=D9QND8_BRESC|nr:SDR family NAD(P)-dependent oxidoreductase [Brevundimonas subvibrioides]ADL00339.1 short-chain dehydrogenase/reductase SDR [Brevundimonas subvibrioides ATCC 15264]